MDLVANVAVTTAIYALVAVGLSTIYGVLRVLHIAHAAVYVVGAFAAFRVAQLVPNLWLALLVAVGVSGVVGVLIYRLLYQPVLDQPRSVPLLISVGVLIALTELLRLPWFFGPSVHPLRLSGQLPAVQIGGFALTSIQVTIIVVAAVCVLAVSLLVNRTQLGLSWRAITEDRQMAGSFGIDVNRSVAVSFLVGSALAGVAAVLFGVYTNAVSASMGDVIAYKAFVIVVLGGLGSVGGATAASLVLALAEILAARYLGGILPRDVIAFIVLIGVLLIRPQGLVRTVRG